MTTAEADIQTPPAPPSTAAAQSLPCLQRPDAPWWYTFSAWMVTLWAMCFFKLRVFGRENIPARGGVLIASTHQSFLEPMLIPSVSRRFVHLMARESLFRNALGGAIIRHYGAFPVKRGGLGLDGLRQAIDLLQSGRAVVFFPEGTRTLDGSIGELHPGAVIAAQRAGAPVVPAVIDGAFNAWPRSAKMFAAREIKLIFGRPIDVAGLDKNDASILVRNEMLRLREELQYE